ncbi:MAG: hypothetical protein US63_C0010G0020 [Candidatus Moranbacteria bacterium GW2011_GWC2_37_8]|nr:MAG: hypothetical protein US63_C0010G0020 [Candidatus Moranbacteria bacterium GW2011_GWC2_37_8]KKQ63360.1 MAG: hypothetical protein US82_C0001G0029 [Parcubacteria group bacterium GW2011_GWC1_38_22]
MENIMSRHTNRIRSSLRSNREKKLSVEELRTLKAAERLADLKDGIEKDEKGRDESTKTKPLPKSNKDPIGEEYIPLPTKPADIHEVVNSTRFKPLPKDSDRAKTYVHETASVQAS